MFQPGGAPGVGPPAKASAVYDNGAAARYQANSNGVGLFTWQ
jgi:hypothetical protein